MEKLALFILMLGTVGLIAWRLRSSAKRRAYSPKTTKGQDAPHPYHCVSIRSRADACEVAKQLADKRFLSSEAPLLPLANCTAASCRCRYAHYEDRRESDEDQRAPLRGWRDRASERRSGRDRRSYSPTQA